VSPRLSVTGPPLSGAERQRRYRDRTCPNRGPGPRLNEDFRSACWCRESFVDVTPEETQACLTRPCGRRECQRMDREARA
jgi:hypothetical protein